MRLTNFLIEVGGFAQTGSAASNTRSTMIAHSTASYVDGIIGGSGAAHVFAFGSFIEEGTNTQQNMFLSGDQNVLRSDGTISFTGSLSSIASPNSSGEKVRIRSNLLFIAKTKFE